MAGSIKLAPLLTEIKVDIENFKNDMEKASAIGTSEAKRISKEMETTAKVGKNFSKAGDLLTKGLTLPIVGVGAATTKMAVDFESSFAKVSTLLDSNVVDFAQYKNELLDASSETKVAVDEFSEAVYSSISAGVDQKEAIQFTTDAMKLAKGGFTDGAKAVDVLTTAINAYGLEASDATRVSDLLITTQNLGKTTVDELASSMGTVIPVANASNFSIEELSASYAQLTKNGVATAESGTCHYSRLYCRDVSSPDDRLYRYVPLTATSSFALAAKFTFNVSLSSISIREYTTAPFFSKVISSEAPYFRKIFCNASLPFCGR